MSAPATRRFGNYDILSLMGKGGMAEVYRARVVEGPRAGLLVALKRLSPALAKDAAAVEAFATEADLTKLLDHPNVVKVYEVGVIDDVYFMVMELIEGRDVGQVLRRCQQRGIAWPIDFAVYLAKVLLDALGYAHQAKSPSGAPLGIVHCDVSPSNLFVSRTGDIKLGDFGVARARSGMASDRGVVGKPYYLSPEVLDGQVTPAADLWAATVSLYELLTLERPFTGATPAEVFTAIRGRLHTSVRMLRPEVSEALEEIVNKGLAIDPADRFQTAAQMSEALTPHFDERVGTPLAISAMVRGLFG
ncbi:MAG: serine/threonine-protein kinase [Myxococcota bacterium]